MLADARAKGHDKFDKLILVERGDTHAARCTTALSLSSTWNRKCTTTDEAVAKGAALYAAQGIAAGPGSRFSGNSGSRPWAAGEAGRHEQRFRGRGSQRRLEPSREAARFHPDRTCAPNWLTRCISSTYSPRAWESSRNDQSLDVVYYLLPPQFRGAAGAHIQ